MQNTSRYRTKSILNEQSNATAAGCWPVAIDIGYSSVKGYSPHTIFAFPSYAKKIGADPEFIGDLAPETILYRDTQTKEVWLVGADAQNELSDNDTSDSQKALFGRNRYYSQMFKVILRCGIAMGILGKDPSRYRNEPIYIQTGLPPAYLKEDKQELINAISGMHEFSVRFGGMKSFKHVGITIDEKNVTVMPQPKGTLVSICYSNNANPIPEAARYMKSSSVIFDAGFGTLDLYQVEKSMVKSCESFSQFGMNEVLRLSCDRIFSTTGVLLRPSTMQWTLERGEVSINKRTGAKVTERKEPIGDIVDTASDEICENAIMTLLDIYPNLEKLDYLILTGGTCAAWEKKIRELLGDREKPVIINGNINCPSLDMIFCNVRGYYMLLVDNLRHKSSNHS